MRLFSFLVFLLPVLSLAAATVELSQLLTDQRELVFSGTVAESSEALAVTLWNSGDDPANGMILKISGADSDAFKWVGASSFSLKPNQAATVRISFCPPEGKVGSLKAVCEVVSATGETVGRVELFGLSALGVEGPREQTLALILKTLGLQVDIGWDSLHSDTGPALIGAEIPQHRFRKASAADVSLLPVARYSPNFLLPFGTYTLAGEKPVLSPVGTLCLKTNTRAEHNCLYPRLAGGTTSFDPGAEPFGIFTASRSHVTYSEDALNARLEPKHIAHALRVYPVANRAGILQKNTYLLCFEEAKNGDYQDYVFLLSNVIPVE